MKIKDIMEKIEAFSPLSLSEEFVKKTSGYDNVGLLLGDDDVEVKGVYACLEVNLNELKAAKELGANLVISHHPFIYYGVTNLSSSNAIGREVAFAINSGIAIYSCHLNMDSAVNGIDDNVAKLLNITTTDVFTKLNGGGYGKIGNVKKTSLKQYASELKNTFKSVRTAGNEDKQIEKVISLCGGGADNNSVAFAINNKLDAIISCDFKSYMVKDLLNACVAVIELSHGESEYLAFKMALENIDFGVKISFSESDYIYYNA